MTAEVTAKAVRPVGYRSFEDLVPAEPASITTNPDGTLTVTFPDCDPPLSEDTLAAVRNRMESRTDTEAALQLALAEARTVNEAFQGSTPDLAAVIAHVFELDAQILTLIAIVTGDTDA